MTNGTYLDQDAIDTWVNFSRKKNNPLNFGFIKAYIRCYDPDQVNRYEIKKTRSRKYKPAKLHRFIEKDIIDYLIDKLSPKLSHMVRLMFETGLRREEILNIQVKDLNLIDREIVGIGKNNKQFRVRFSPTTKDLLLEWCMSNHLRNDNKVFEFFKKGTKIPLKNQEWQFWYELRKQCESFGVHGVHPHRIRHSLGYFLRADKGFDLEQVRVKLRHSNLETTKIYASATEDEIAMKEDKEVFD